MIPLFKVFMSKDIINPVNEKLLSGYITQGSSVDQFEKELSKYLEKEYVLTLNSATAGLTLALRLLKGKNNIDPSNYQQEICTKHDTVLTPALTCFATTAAILANGMKIKWLDVDPETCNVNLDDLKNKLSNSTKVIYLVHWGGRPIDYDKLEEVLEYSLERFGFKPFVVEDCAHAFGAKYNNKRIGYKDGIQVYSFQAIKHLTTVDGGAITLPNQEMYDRCKLLRWYGIDRDKRNFNKKDFRLENNIEEWGYKFHMNDINATIGLNNLPHINKLLEISRKNEQYYNENLKDLKGVKILKINPKIESANWLYTIFVENKTNFIKYMEENGVMTSQVHNRNDTNSSVKQFISKLPELDKVEKELVCIPVGWWVTKNDRELIVNLIKEFSLKN